MYIIEFIDMKMRKLGNLPSSPPSPMHNQGDGVIHR